LFCLALPRRQARRKVITSQTVNFMAPDLEIPRPD
jgi:hypothetical protein